VGLPALKTTGFFGYIPGVSELGDKTIVHCTECDVI